MTIQNPKRIPRKIKKVIIKKFGRHSYKKLFEDDRMCYMAKIVGYFNLDNTVKEKYLGHTMFYDIHDGF